MQIIDLINDLKLIALEPVRAAGILLTLVTTGIILQRALRAYMIRLRRRAWYKQQNDLKALRALSWQEFEVLVAEMFRQRGYKVKITGGGGADGGIDIILSKSRKKFLVQCKHYKRSSVGAPVVRELLGVSVREKAAGIYIVTVGSFTRSAKAFAVGLPIRLIDGEDLLRKINPAGHKVRKV